MKNVFDEIDAHVLLNGLSNHSANHPNDELLKSIEQILHMMKGNYLQLVGFKGSVFQGTMKDIMILLIFPMQFLFSTY